MDPLPDPLGHPATQELSGAQKHGRPAAGKQAGKQRCWRVDAKKLRATGSA